MDDIELEDKIKIADLREKYPYFSHEYLSDMFFVIRYHGRATEKKKVKFAIRMIDVQGLSIDQGGEIAIHEARMNSDFLYKNIYDSLKEDVDMLRKQKLDCLKYVLKHNKKCKN
jgi:hypothetical protein